MVPPETNDDPKPSWITVTGLVLQTPLELDRAAALEQLRRLLEDPSLSPEARSFIEACLQSATEVDE